MNYQRIPPSDLAAVDSMVKHGLAHDLRNKRFSLIGEIDSTNQASAGLSLIDEVGQCSRPFDCLPGRLNRWPFCSGYGKRLAVRLWNLMSRDWRALADKSFRALYTLHDRVTKLEKAEGLRAEMDALTRRIAELEVRQARADVKRGGTYLDDAVITNFMESVAQRFRGDADVTTRRLSAHLAAVQVAIDAVPGKPALDLGCGHGEWLLLMRDSKVPAYGVDLSPDCVAACRDLKIDVDHGDALQALDDAAPGRVSVVSAFHLIEHLPLDAQIALFTKAYTALAPGGLLLLETPNPENMHSIGNMFWWDPTHQRPVPSSLLKLFAEVAGFSRIETHAINPPDTPTFEIEHYPPRIRHMLFCGLDTVIYAYK